MTLLNTTIVADELSRTGRATALINGKRLLLTTTIRLDLPGDELILAFEGGGVIFFGIDRPLNRFRLMSNGFPERVVDALVPLVNEVITILVGRRRVEATNYVALEGSKE